VIVEDHHHLETTILTHRDLLETMKGHLQPEITEDLLLSNLEVLLGSIRGEDHHHREMDTMIIEVHLLQRD